MATITQQKLQEILSNAPQGTTEAGIIKALESKGHTIEAQSIPFYKKAEFQPKEKSRFQKGAEGVAEAYSSLGGRIGSAFMEGQEFTASGIEDIKGAITGGPRFDPTRNKWKKTPDDTLSRIGQAGLGISKTLGGIAESIFSPATGIAMGAQPQIESAAKTTWDIFTPEGKENIINYVEEITSDLTDADKDSIRAGLAALDFAEMGTGSVVREGVGSLTDVARRSATDLKDQLPNQIGRMSDNVISNPVVKQTTQAFDRNYNILKNRTQKAFENLPTSFKDVKGKIDTKRQKKILGQIDTEVDNFINNKQSLIRAADKYKSKNNTDVVSILKDPEIFSGLKVVDKKLDPTEAIYAIDDRVDILLDSKREMLPVINKFVQPRSKQEIRELAIENLGDLTEADKFAEIRRIDNQLEPMPDSLNGTQLDDFRRRLRKSSRKPDGSLKDTNEYTALELATRDLVFKMADELPIKEKGGSFANLNTYIKDLVNTKNFLQNQAKGKLVSSGKMTKLINTATGAIIGGSMGGPFGGILGSQMSGAITDILANRKLSNAVKSKLLKDLMGDSPESVKLANDLLKQSDELMKKGFPMLPEGRADLPRSEVRNQGVIQMGSEAAKVSASGQTLQPQTQAKIVGTTTPETRSAGMAFSETISSGGATIDIKSGTIPKNGYAISPYKDLEFVLDADSLDEDAILSYIDDNSEIFDKPNHQLGLWKNPEDGKVYMDIVVVEKDANSAYKLAQENDQIAFYDLGKGQEINTSDFSRSSEIKKRITEKAGQSIKRDKGLKGSAAEIQEASIEKYSKNRKKLIDEYKN